MRATEVRSQKSNISLIGFMGTGKSSVGPILAIMLKKSFVELDAEIEKVAGQSISDIFASSGEGQFRKIEKEILVKVLDHENIVLSCGGGVILDAKNRTILKKRSIVVWLNADAKVITERLMDNKSRPLLAENVMESVSKLLKERIGFYRETSEVMVRTNGMETSQVALNIAEKIGAKYGI